jgi:hypothetical protein
VSTSVFESLGVRNNPRRAGLIALVLWAVLAAVVWNVVFDRVVVLAGREYVYAATWRPRPISRTSASMRGCVSP